jgi:hypothetical protein
MSVFTVTTGGVATSIIDTQGNSQPISAATNPSPFPTSSSVYSPTAVAASDIKTTTSNTNQPIANRA